MRGLRRIISGIFFSIVAIIAFMAKAVLFMIGVIFAALWGLLWLVFHLIRLPSPHYRRKYRCKKFDEAVARVRAVGQTKRDAASRQSSRDNLSELADLALAELDLRKGDIAPNVLEMTRRSIEICIENANIDRVNHYYKIIQDTETDGINRKLMNM